MFTLRHRQTDFSVQLLLATEAVSEAYARAICHCLAAIISHTVFHFHELKQADGTLESQVDLLL